MLHMHMHMHMHMHVHMHMHMHMPTRTHAHTPAHAPAHAQTQVKQVRGAASGGRVAPAAKLGAQQPPGSAHRMQRRREAALNRTAPTSG